MHTKTFCCFLMVVLAVVGSAAPSRIAVVPASGRAALEQLAQAGVMEYGRTRDHVFAAPAPLLAAQSSVELSLGPDREA